jgi:hypothetical protein
MCIVVRFIFVVTDVAPGYDQRGKAMSSVVKKRRKKMRRKKHKKQLKKDRHKKKSR